MNIRNGTNDNGGQEVSGPMDALQDQSLAVDLALAEIDSQIATAHKYPRSLDTVIKKISTMACYNEQAAENCVYALPRGGKPIIGPSIGFANIVFQAWGNCRVGGRHTYTDRKEKTVEAQGIFHDLESNSATSLSVQRRISGKDGRIYSDDMIGVTGNAAASIARRNAILNAVPRALWFPIWEQALQIVRGTAETFSERKDKALKAFAQFGVKPEQIFMFLGLKGEPDLTIEHIPTLRGMYQQLRDGTITVEEMFDPRRMTGMGFEQVKNPLADQDEDEDEPAEPPGAQPAGTVAGTQQAGQAATGPGKAQGAPAGAEAQGQGGKDAGKPTAATSRTKGAKKPKDQQEPKPSAEDVERDRQAAHQEPQPDPKPEPPKPTVPKTCEEYLAHASAYIAAATSVSGLEQQWKSEKDLRGTCSVIGEAFPKIRGIYLAKIAQLHGD